MTIIDSPFPSGESEGIDLILLRSALFTATENCVDPEMVLAKLPEVVYGVLQLVKALYSSDFLGALADLTAYEHAEPHIFTLPGMPDDADHYRAIFEMGRDYLIETGHNLARLSEQ